MNNSLIIATTNSHRRKVLFSIIKKEFPQINVKMKKIEKISPETNSKAAENAAEKAKFYGVLFKNNVLCEDNTIKINGEEISPNKNLLRKRDIYKDWKNIIKRNPKVKGKIIKAFSLNYHGKIKTIKIEIPIVFVLPEKDPIVLKDNPLNYLITVKGYIKTLSNFNEEEINRFRTKEVKALNKLLKVFEI